MPVLNVANPLRSPLDVSHARTATSCSAVKPFFWPLAREILGILGFSEGGFCAIPTLHTFEYKSASKLVLESTPTE